MTLITFTGRAGREELTFTVMGKTVRDVREDLGIRSPIMDILILKC